MTTLRPDRTLGRRVACALAATLVLALAPSTAAQDIPREELSKARETFFKEESPTVRERAARTLVASGKKVHREAVVDAMFETYEQPDFCRELLSLVRAFLVGPDHEPLAKVARRVRDLADSSNDAKQLHGFRLAAWLGVGGLDDELGDVLDDALDVVLAAEEGAPKRPELLTEARRAIDVAIDAYVAGAPDAPRLAEWLDVLVARDDPIVRLAAYEAFADLDVERYRHALSAGAADPDARIGALCVEALVEWGDERAVPALFAALPYDDSLDTRLLPALFRLTGERIRSRERWESWWRQRPDDFAVLDEEAYETLLEQLVEARSASQYGPAGSFFGFAAEAGGGVVFLIDVSGSMETIHSSHYSDDVFMPARDARTRLEVVKEQVLHAIAGFDGTPFDIVAFRGDVRQWSPRGSESFPTYASAVASARTFVEALEPGGGTALHAGLELALSLPVASEVVVLSDGEPSVGLSSTDAIVADVRRWNDKRDEPADLHVIGLAFRGELLDALGAVTPGSSVRTID